jgi:hypothetical protein
MVLILRDPAHAVRIACRDPLHAETRFKEQMDRLFGRHGLVPDVQYSEVWKLKLQTCQRRVLDATGSQGGGLAHVLRHFSYAKQRFDSFAAPLRKYCCMVNAIALLLATVATDMRQPAATRARAALSLEAMTFENLLTAGVSADYAEECADFIRQFDIDDHDPAVTLAQARRFEERMQYLFQQAYTLSKPAAGQTLTNVVIQQCREAQVIPYGDRVKVLWTRGCKEAAKLVMKSIQVVVDTMLERVRASFVGGRWFGFISPRRVVRIHGCAFAVVAIKCEFQCEVRAEFYSRDLVASFECFSMEEWAVAMDAHQTDDGARVTELIRKAKRVFRALGLDVAAGVRELETAAHAVDRAFGPRFEPDNRCMWALVLSPEYSAENGPIVALHRAVQFYISVADGSCDLERALGTMTNIMDKHDGPLSEDGVTTWALVELAIDGPQNEAEVFVQASQPADLSAAVEAKDDVMLRFTDFSRICAQRWVRQHGRRFGIYATRADKGSRSRGVALGTDAAVVAARRAAATDLVAAAKAAAPGASLEDTVVDCPRSGLVRGRRLQDSSCWNDTLGRFHRLTLQKETQKRALEQARSANTNPYPAGPMRLGGLFAQQDASIPAGPPLRARRRLKLVLWPRTLLAANLSRFEILTDKSADMARADIIVADSVASLLDTPTPTTIRASIIIVCLGKSVVDIRHWRGAAPESSTAVVRHKPTALLVTHRICLSAGLRERHQKMCHAFQTCVEAPGSKWMFTDERPTVTINSVSDAVAFVQSVRRIVSRGIGGGTY